MTRVFNFLVGAALVAASACAANQPYAPTGTAQTTTPKGYQAAVYEIVGAHGNWDNVTVKVWTPGIVSQDKAAPVAEVDWRINNNSGSGVRLDRARTRLEIVENNPIEPVPVSDKLEVPANSEATIRLCFPVPKEFEPKKIDTYQVAWSLASGAQHYGQATRFARGENSSDNTYYYAPDPFYTSDFYGAYTGGPEGHSRGGNFSIGVGVGVTR